MDELRFDQLSRRFASIRTRRQAVKALAGAVVAAVSGTRGATAQACTAHYSPCQGDDQCCAGSVCQYGLCMPGCRIDNVFVNAWTSPPGDICNQCLPGSSTTSWTPANDGMSCWSGDPNAGVTICQSGECAPVAPASCPPPTACHLEGTVDPATGMCGNPPAPAGTPCGNQAMCYGEFYQPADACDGNGFCIGGGSQTVPCAPYRCGDGACTTGCNTDDDCASGAHCDEGQCFSDLGLGEPCDEDSDCLSGVCADGVCCNRHCEGLCETCSVETGGYCSPVACDDGLACTTGMCDENTGECSQSLNSGTCLIGDACYTDGATNPSNACQTCDPAADPNAWTTVICADDGLSCTTNSCDPASGCGLTIIGGFCLIDGACYADGAINSANTCQLCDTERSTTAWSVLDLGCPDGGVCMNGACVTSITGGLSAGDGHDPCFLPATYFYDTYTITHAGGPLQIGLRGADGGGGTLSDPWLALRATGGDECQAIYANDNGTCGRDSYINIGDLAAGAYVVVASSFDWSATGSYTLTFGQGPAC